MEWLIYALVAMVLFSIVNVVLKKVLSEPSFSKLDVSSLSKALGNMNSGVALLLVILVISALSGFYAFLHAMQSGKAAVVVAVVGLSTVGVAVLSLIFLGDTFAIKEIAAIVLATASILVLVL